jgi:hypothetical protein
MLETCLDIHSCESHLKQHLKLIRLIGQIPLTDEDIKRIDHHIQTNLKGKFSENIDEIQINTPTMFAYYLVWKGIQNYDEGTYWDSINNEIGPIDTNQQGKLGRFFQGFVQANNLLYVEIPGARRYITPILLHGIIPIHMISNFFKHVVDPLYRRELVNPTDKSEIEYWLESKRKQVTVNQDTSGLEQEIKKLEKRIEIEEKTLEDYKKKATTLYVRPEDEAVIQRDLKRVESLLENNEILKNEMELLNNARNGSIQKFQEIQFPELKYSPEIIDFEPFRQSIFKLIVDSIEKSLNHTDEKIASEARTLLVFFYQANLNGKIKIPNDITQKIKALHRNKEVAKNNCDSS